MKYTLYHRKKTQLADLYTPVSVYAKLRDRFPYSILLESADYHDRTDNKSIVCLCPLAGFEAQGLHCSVQYPGSEVQSILLDSYAEVLPQFTDFVNAFKVSKVDGNDLASGIWGYTSFEAVQYMEDIVLPDRSSDLKLNPDLKYHLYKFTLVFDHFKKEIDIIQTQVGSQIKEDTEIDDILRILGSNDMGMFQFKSTNTEQSNVTDAEFMSMVSRGISHCKRGDCFQVVLSRQFSQGFTGDDFCLYRSLRSISPSPYLFYFDYGAFRIFGSSPESQLQVNDGKATINPIAGTVKRGHNNEEDQNLAEELQNNPKEKAEHVMLVDLARNDLSKSSDDVDVEVYGEIQYFSQVIHMVSKVTGTLNTSSNGLRVFCDTFPAGTLSGAPKYRALEIIGENENVSRNFYGGALGFLGFDGSVNHAIIIRSLLSKNNTLVYQAGAGIVSESSPEGELNEVNNKLSAIRLAINKANAL